MTCWLQAAAPATAQPADSPLAEQPSDARAIAAAQAWLDDASPNIDPDDGTTWRTLEAAAAASPPVRRALADYLLTALPRHAHNPDRFLQLARHRSLLEQHNAAFDALWNGINTHPRAEPLYAALLDITDPDDGRSPLRDADAATRRVVLKLIRDAPDTTLGRLVRAEWAVALNQPQTAEGLYAQLLAEQPGLPAAVQGLATMRLNAQRRDDALALVRGMLDARPDDDDALAIGADLYRRLGDPDAADALTERRLLRVDRPYTLASFYAERGRHHDAIATIERLHGRPDVMLQEWLGLWTALVRAAGDPAAGLARLDDWTDPLGLDDDDDDRHAIDRARSVLLAADGRWPEARDLLRRMLDDHPDDIDLLNRLGLGMVRRGEDPDAALILLQRAVDLHAAEDAATLDSLGWALYLLGRFDEAAPLLLRADIKRRGALDTTPDALLLLHLGDVMYRVGNGTKARQSWEAAARDARRLPAGLTAPELAGLADRLQARIDAIAAGETPPITPTLAEAAAAP